jgi:hypothetical protein
LVPLVKKKLKEKHIFYICEKYIKDYARVIIIRDIIKELKELDITNTKMQKILKIQVNINRKKKYKNEIKFLFFCFFTENNQTLTNKYEFIYNF